MSAPTTNSTTSSPLPSSRPPPPSSILTHDRVWRDWLLVSLLKLYFGRQRSTRRTPQEQRVHIDAAMHILPAAPASVVQYEQAVVGGVSGWWVRPLDARKDAVLLYIHGGGYIGGSAKGYSAVGSQFATHAAVGVFVPDYRLAPEQPFPAANDDVNAALTGLLELGYSSVVIAGDSAGGGLALSLAATLSEAQRRAVRGVIAISPCTDLAMTGASFSTTSDAMVDVDIYGEWVAHYLHGHAARDPLASPLYADLSHLPPVQLMVATDELFKDDGIGFAERAIAAGRVVECHVWKGMLHCFPLFYGKLHAADVAMELMTGFLRDRLPVD